MLFLGVGNIWWVPLSNWIGRRPILLVATLIMTLCSVWCGLATSYESLVVARIFQGIGGAAADTVAPALVGDLYFVHERGRAMVWYYPTDVCLLYHVTHNAIGSLHNPALCRPYSRRYGWWVYRLSIRVGVHFLGQRCLVRLLFCRSCY